jgi:hypothetical protein
MTDGHDKEPRRLAAKLKKQFQRTDLMNRLMNDLFGSGNWVYDARDDVWVARNDRGPGVYVIRRGGDWFVANVRRGAAS